MPTNNFIKYLTSFLSYYLNINYFLALVIVYKKLYSQIALEKKSISYIKKENLLTICILIYMILIFFL